MKENWFKSLLRSLEENNYVRFAIILILGLLFVGGYKLGQWQDTAFDTVQKSAEEREALRKEFQTREDSLRKALTTYYDGKLDKVENAFERYKENDRRNDSLRLAEFEQKDREDKRVVRAFRSEAAKTDKISKALDSAGNKMTQ